MKPAIYSTRLYERKRPTRFLLHDISLVSTLAVSIPKAAAGPECCLGENGLAQV